MGHADGLALIPFRLQHLLRLLYPVILLSTFFFKRSELRTEQYEGRLHSSSLILTTASVKFSPADIGLECDEVFSPDDSRGNDNRSGGRASDNGDAGSDGERNFWEDSSERDEDAGGTLLPATEPLVSDEPVLRIQRKELSPL